MVLVLGVVRSIGVGISFRKIMPEKNIEIGDQVEVIINGRLMKLKIVSGPGDLSKGQLNVTTPVGQAILGRRVGESCSLTITPPKTLNIKIIKIL